jgi:hypothetical protein
LGKSDEEQLAFAAAQERAIYTFNASDFVRLHRQFLKRAHSHSGIIVIPEQRYLVGEMIRRIAAFVQSVTADSLRNRIEFL